LVIFSNTTVAGTDSYFSTSSFYLSSSINLNDDSGTECTRQPIDMEEISSVVLNYCSSDGGGISLDINVTQCQNLTPDGYNAVVDGYSGAAPWVATSTGLFSVGLSLVPYEDVGTVWSVNVSATLATQTTDTTVQIKFWDETRPYPSGEYTSGGQVCEAAIKIDIDPIENFNAFDTDFEATMQSIPVTITVLEGFTYTVELEVNGASAPSWITYDSASDEVDFTYTSLTASDEGVYTVTVNTYLNERPEFTNSTSFDFVYMEYPALAPISLGGPPSTTLVTDDSI
jgi:hypothetical protein